MAFASIAAGLFAYWSLAFLFEFFDDVIKASSEFFLFYLPVTFLGFALFPLLFCFTCMAFMLLTCVGIAVHRRFLTWVSASSCALFGIFVVVSPPPGTGFWHGPFAEQIQPRVFCLLFALIPLVVVLLHALMQARSKRVSSHKPASAAQLKGASRDRA